MRRARFQLPAGTLENRAEHRIRWRPIGLYAGIVPRGTRRLAGIWRELYTPFRKRRARDMNGRYGKSDDAQTTYLERARTR